MEPSLPLQDRDYMRDSEEQGLGRGSVSFASIALKLGILHVAVFLAIVVVANLVLEQAYGIAGAEQRFLEWLGLIPQKAIGSGYIWQLVTYMFVHGPRIPGVFHLLFVLMALYVAGSELEVVYGKSKLLLLYVGSGVAAGIAHCFLWGLSVPVAGATGACYGLLTAFAMVFPRRQVLFLFLFPIEVRILVPLLIGFDLALFMASKEVFAFAHLGGALAGFLFCRYEMRVTRYLERVEARAERQEALALEEMEARVDAILDKINRDGMTSLSRKERDFLKKASRHYQRKA